MRPILTALALCSMATLGTAAEEAASGTPPPSPGKTPFELADTNGDGKLTPDEVPTYTTEYFFQQGDTNNDGKLSQEEARAMHTPKTETAPPTIEVDHTAADTNGDGQLDKQEFSKALDKEGNVNLVVNSYDIDKNNEISDTELQSSPVNVGISFKF